MNKYQVVSIDVGFSHKKSLVNLTEAVNQARVEGWVPTGGVGSHGPHLMQAMVKPR